MHLIAAHHGHARPLLPAVEDPAVPESITVDHDTVDTRGFQPVDWDGPGRFTRLNHRYGRWGLALLESIVRLADIACSAGEYQPKDAR